MSRACRSWDAVRQEVEMKRIVAVVLVAAVLIGGTLIRPLAVRAQPTDFPFNAGDAVTIQYSDTAGLSHPCVIDRFYGSFVSCRPQTGGPANVVQKPFVYNLSSAVSVSL